MQYSRRKFLKFLSGFTATVGLGFSRNKLTAMNISNLSTRSGEAACIPRPIQVVIDDVGWWSGWDGSGQQEPFRTGISRDHTLADYKSIIELGRSLNICPQAAMVLCEWDRENILRDLPDSTWMGINWDNGKWAGPWLDEAADLICNNPDHFEFTVHGIGHEYWSGGNLSRAEWATADGTMRTEEFIHNHLEYYQKIMQQNRLGSFPQSFVPAAFNHGFGTTAGNQVSLAELLNGFGISYINTPFYKMQNADKVKNAVFGLDAGVLTIDRGNDLLNWNVISSLPKGEIPGPTCGMHWPNLLHENPERNSEIVQGWAAFLRPYDDRLETLLAQNSDHFQKQLIHHISTRIRVAGKQIELDFSEADKLGTEKAMDGLTVKFRSSQKTCFDSQDLDILSSSAVREDSTILYTLILRRRKTQSGASISFSKHG